MASWPSAAQVVIIHRGQIVMDQRVTMDHFQSTSISQGLFEVCS
jgi:hypothetical protein